MEEMSTNNERSLQQLAWAIEASVGQFKLILARCNYASLRNQLIERLRQICSVEIRILVLKESEKTLFSTIREELGHEAPACLMVLGLESVQNFSQMLISANQVREEFRHHFSFPLILWIDDATHKQFMEFAPDFESWATTRNFTISQEVLANFIRETAGELFGNTPKFNRDDYLSLENELEAAQGELLDDTQIPNVELEVNLKALLGFVKQVNFKIDDAIDCYQASLELWQKTSHFGLQGKTLENLAFCYYLKAFKKQDVQHPDWQNTQHWLREYLKFIAQNKCIDLIPNIIAKFGEIIQETPECKQLQKLAEQAIKQHRAENKLIELSRDCGFLAEVALFQQKWEKANTLAKDALKNLTAIPESELSSLLSDVDEASRKAIISRDVNLYRLILARSQFHLNQPLEAIHNLELAKQELNPQLDLSIYLNILNFLQKLYHKQKEYLQAYDIKQEQCSVEQQFGLRAFIGAGRLQSSKQVNLTSTKVLEIQNFPSLQENVSPEIRASGRLLDVERLIERIGRHDYKLIVIHGQSGVGKSSLVNAGLVPALKKKAIGFQDNLVIAIRVYTNWVEELGKMLPNPLVNLSSHPSPLLLIVEQLRQCKTHNIRPILIFDQFEEFFFVKNEPAQRQEFFKFLRECLKILPLKVILSLREDYLHYLLKFNRLQSGDNLRIDILSENVLYELGNFSTTDTKKIIANLTERSNFHLEPDLIDELVKNLAGDTGEVRPIELQVVGAQLQTENITTLERYRECGTKEELVNRYLQEVVRDCGEENKQAAEFVLYLLTDEKGTRPLKTQVELETNLKELAGDLAETSKLNLVLQIFVKSGLVLFLPENPADRYQLVHDYLAAFIRQQQEPKLTQLMAELEKERKQRKQSEDKLNRLLKRALLGSVAAGFVLAVLAVTAWHSAQQEEQQRKQAEINEIKALANSSEAFSSTGETLGSIVDGIKAGTKLKNATWATQDIKLRVVATLQQAVYLHPQEQQTIEVNTLEGHNSYVNSLAWGADGKQLASGSSDKTIKIWDVTTGKQLRNLTGHNSYVNSLAWSADGKQLASGSSDKTIKLWDVATSKQLKTLSGHDSYVNSLAWSADGKQLASGSLDNTIKLWDVATGKQLKTLSGHSRSVTSVAWRGDGKQLASASWDKTIKLWHVATGKELKTLIGHGYYVY
ncbi:hypothetical protein NUACC21_28920 [Scytonema sp. NUACC21]